MENIVFSGMTAAGKTTHAKLLARQLGFEYVAAIDVILALLGINKDPEGIWTREPRLFDAFNDPSLNRAVDAQLVELSKTRGGVVFDAWALPWLSDAPMMKIWVESDVASRRRKVLVSQLRSGIAADSSILERKDLASRDNFLNTYGFDILNDRTPFDAILDNTELIPTATIAASDLGISRFAPVVRDACVAWQSADHRSARQCEFAHRSHVRFLRAR